MSRLPNSSPASLPTKAPACTQVARTLAEPVRGTAARAHGWLLIAHAGPWARDAFTHRGFPPDVVSTIRQRCQEAGIRPQLIRPTGRTAQIPGRIQVFLAYSGREGPWLHTVQVNSPEQILSLDIEAAAAARPIAAGRAVRTPIYLVCTHGKKDACCAVYGRRVTRALRAQGDRVWESTHLGGDRFAAGVVALPEGIYYGHLDPGTAPTLIDHHDDGRILTPHFRGRCTDSPLQQIAEALVREHLDVKGIVDVVPHTPQHNADGSVEVLIDLGSSQFRARLGSVPSESRLTSCTTTTTGNPDHYQLVDFTPDDH